MMGAVEWFSLPNKHTARLDNKDGIKKRKWTKCDDDDDDDDNNVKGQKGFPRQLQKRRNCHW